MMVRRADARRDAPALRFLLLCVGGWIVLRVMMLWNPALSLPPMRQRRHGCRLPPLRSVPFHTTGPQYPGRGRRQ
jgi:hypothetical protein